MKVIDGEGLLLGRLCSYAAKAALLGEEVRIVNCEKVVAGGERQKVFWREKRKQARGGYPPTSPKFSRQPDRFVRKVVRGMLPRKTERGRLAYKRVLGYNGVPEELGKEKAETIEKARATKLPTLKYVTIGEICRWLGGKK